MYAVLGGVEFDLITYFDGMETRFGADYAEHPLIGRKPRLQQVGDQLDEIRIDLVFHAAYCDPVAELARLRQAMASHDARSLVLGNGDYKGRFVISGLTATVRQTDNAGTLLALEASLQLREYTGDPARPAAPAVRPLNGAPRLPSEGAQVSGLPANVPATASSSLSGAVTAVKAGLSSASQALSAVAAVQRLANGDVLSALARLPNLARSLEATLPGLGVASDRMAEFATLASVAADAGQVAVHVAHVRDGVSAVAGNLAQATSADLLSRLTTAAASVKQATTEIQQAALPLARLTAKAITRTL